MPINHIHFQHGTPHGALLHSALTRFEDAFSELNEILGAMQLMIDGDGSLADHFAYMQDKFGFVDNAGAKAAWEELNSLMFKLNTDMEVTAVNAAMKQAFNKFR